MREETRRAALRAAARVALGALAYGASVGCGGHITTGGPSSDLDPDEHLATEAPESPDAPGSPDAPDDAAPAGGDGGAAPTAEEPAPGCTPAEGDPDCSEAAQPEPPELACAEPASLDDAEARPRAELDCCLGYTAERAPERGAGLSEQEVAALAEDASFVNCCTALIVGVGAGAISYPEAEPVRGVCCFGDVVAPEQELYFQTFCTPWGPPVPPALDADAAPEVA
ncbi:hypothetical protein [Sorangium sp. So ce394]|uniref:hypothetical protein n=1 Tax=Sorangium sp. So ce394 TaxID=3133310 RepID=UPI003F5B8B03